MIVLLLLLAATQLDAMSPTRPLKMTTEYSLVTPRNSPVGKSALLEEHELCEVLSSHGMELIQNNAHKQLINILAQLNQCQRKYQLGCTEIATELEKKLTAAELKIVNTKAYQESNKTDLMSFVFDKFIIEHAQILNQEHAKIKKYLDNLNS